MDAAPKPWKLHHLELLDALKHWKLHCFEHLDVPAEFTAAWLMGHGCAKPQFFSRFEFLRWIAPRPWNLRHAEWPDALSLWKTYWLFESLILVVPDLNWPRSAWSASNPILAGSARSSPSPSFSSSQQTRLKCQIGKILRKYRLRELEASHIRRFLNLARIRTIRLWSSKWSRPMQITPPNQSSFSLRLRGPIAPDWSYFPMRANEGHPGQGRTKMLIGFAIRNVEFGSLCGQTQWKGQLWHTCKWNFQHCTSRPLHKTLFWKELPLTAAIVL